jgi:phosphatidylinositol glycan class B
MQQQAFWKYLPQAGKKTSQTFLKLYYLLLFCHASSPFSGKVDRIPFLIPATSQYINLPMKAWQVYFLSIFSLLMLAYLSVGWDHPDEHFQILEFAALKMHMTTPDKLPWEYQFQIRPAFQPALVVSAHAVFSLFGCTDPFMITLFLRIITAALAFTAMLMIYRCYAPEIKNPILQKWFLSLSFLLWFALYNDVRFRSETWSGSIFIIGFAWYFLLKREHAWRDFFIAGILLGLSFVIRFQSGFLVGGFVLWMMVIRRDSIALLAMLILGIGAAVLAGVILDRWFYGEWTFTAWNYLQQNILEDKVSGFGIQPWWFYIWDVFIRAVPPFSLLFIIPLLIVVFFLRKDVLTWVLVPFILVHFLIGHKETRFLHPIIGFLPILAIKAYEYIEKRWKITLAGNRYFMGFIKVFWYSNMLLIFTVFFIPADRMASLYECIYDGYPEPVALYYFSENPYWRAKEINYYKRDNLAVMKTDSKLISAMPAGKKYLVALCNKDPEVALFKQQKLIYTSFPGWLKNFNFNHWLDRTKIWYIYEVN